MNKIAGNILLVAFSVLSAEFLLFVVESVSDDAAYLLAAPWERTQTTVPAAGLERRGNPKRIDHDKLGYRNAVVPKTSDIVLLGDSHTYGTNVVREDNWASNLAEFGGYSVYNMGIGGYGPAHSVVQIDQALAFSPRLIILAVYFGNDFYDSYRLSQSNDQIASLIPASLSDAISSSNSQSSIEEEMEILFRLGGEDTPNSDEIAGPRRFVSQHSRIYGLVRALRYMLSTSNDKPSLLSTSFDDAVASLSEEQLQLCSVFSDGEWRSIFTAPYRGRALDVTDARISAGYAVSVSAITEIAMIVENAGVELLVVLLPTKENVFFNRVTQPEEHAGLAELVQNEAYFKGSLTNTLSELDIRYIDLLDELQAAASQTYFENADGHPNTLGHEIIARSVLTNIRSWSGLAAEFRGD